MQAGVRRALGGHQHNLAGSVGLEHRWSERLFDDGTVARQQTLGAADHRDGAPVLEPMLDHVACEVSASLTVADHHLRLLAADCFDYRAQLGLATVPAVHIVLAPKRPVGPELCDFETGFQRRLLVPGGRPSAPIVKGSLPGVATSPPVSAQPRGLPPVLGLALVAEHKGTPHGAAGVLVHLHGRAGRCGALLYGVPRLLAPENRQLRQIRSAMNRLWANTGRFEPVAVVRDIGVGMGEQAPERVRL